MKRKQSLFVARFLTFFLLFLSVNAWAQLDKIHYIPPFFAPDSVGNVYHDVGDQYIVLTSQEEEPFDVNIYHGEVFFMKVEVSKSNSQLIHLGSGFSEAGNHTGIVNETGRNVVLDDEGFMLEGEKAFFAAIYQRSGAQGDVLTCKGETALGNEFYSGHIFGFLANRSRKSNFLSVMATFDNTQVTFSNPRVRWEGQGANTFTVTLNKNESYALGASYSYIAHAGYDVNDYNGTKVTSTKPIAVNSGSWCGSANTGGSQDIGIDQLVPQSFVGSDYVVVEGYGTPRGEKVIVVATRSNTELYVNDTLEHTFAQAGEYYIVGQEEYSDASNLALRSSKKVYVYQTLSGRNSDVAVGLCFIPPLSCLSNREVNVSYADQVGDPMLNVITEVGASVTINGMPLSKTPQAVIGNPDWVTYRLDNADVLNYDPEGKNFEIVSTHAINAALAFEDGAIGGAGFFSGFGVSPQLLAIPDLVGTEACYPNNALFRAEGYDSYIWYYNNEIIAGENGPTLEPSTTGQYRVSGFTNCGVTKASDPFILKTCLTLEGGGSISEGDKPQPIYIHLGLPAEEDVEYWYRIVPVSATEGHDYKALTGIGIIEQGQTIDSLFVELIDDDLYEGGVETFQFEVYYASNATVQNPILDYQIVDEEPIPKVSIEVLGVCYENSDTCKVLIECFGNSDVVGTFDYYTTDNEDPSGAGRYYTPVSGTYTINAGQYYSYISIPLIDNDILNPEREFSLIIENPNNIELLHNKVDISILDDDSPSAYLSLYTSQLVYDESDGTFEIQLRLDKAQEVTVSCLLVSYSSDFKDDFYQYPKSQRLFFQPGDTLKTFVLDIIDDDIVESDEMFKIYITLPENARIAKGALNLTIKDNDYIPQLLDDNFSCLEDKSLTGNVTSNDVILGDTPVFLNFSPPLTGVFSGDSTGQFFYQPAENFSGAVLFSYGVRDQSGDSVSAKVQVMVQQVNDVPIAYNDTVYTDEDVALDIYPLANDLDIDKTGLSIEDVDDNNLGDVDLFTQYLHYTPYANENGTDVLSYAIQDNEGDPAFAKIVIRVRAVNDVPIANDDDFRMNEDGGASVLDVLLNDEDQDRSGLTLKTILQVVGGEALILDNRVVFTPYPNYWGEASFAYWMEDGEGDSAMAQVRIDVLGANDWPTAVNDAFSVDEDDVLALALLSNDVDDDQRGLSMVRVDSASHGRIYSNNNQWFYQPNANYYGSDLFRYFIEDWNNDGANAWVNITVNSVNEAPIARNDTLSILEDEGVQFQPFGNDEDPDRSGLSFVAVMDLEHGTISVVNDVFTYHSELNYFGDNTFQYIIEDGERDRDTATIVLKVMAVNEKPEAQDDWVVLDEDHSVDIPLLVNDYDPDLGGLWVDTLIYSSQASLHWRGDTLVYTPEANVCGKDTLHYIVSDAQGDKDDARIYITINCINEAPLALADTVVATEDSVTVFFPLNNDEDPDGGGISILQISDPPHGTIAIIGDRYYYTSDLNYNGPDSFSYILKDAQGDKDTAEVVVTVLEKNDYPIANDDYYHVDEDKTLTILALANDSDIEDGVPARFTLHQEPSLGEYRISGADIIYQPFSNRWGYDTMSYVAMDRYGAISDIAYVYIVVDSVNEAPISGNAAVVLNEDGKDTTDVLISAQDPDFSGLALVQVQAGHYGSAQIFNQKLVYEPTPNYYGKDTVRFTIADGEGDQSSSVVIYTVLPVNDVPVANSDRVRTFEDLPLVISPLDNDDDVEDNALNICEVMEMPHYGDVVQNGRKLTYTPNLNWWGLDTLSYLTKDAEGASSNVAFVYITVDSVNEAPIVGDVFVNVSEDVRDTIDVLTYAQSPDFSPLQLVYPELPTVLIPHMPTHGMYAIKDNAIIYQSDLNYYGPDTLSFYVQDGEGDVSSALLRINVLSVNDAPVAYPDSFRFVQGVGEEDKFTVLPLTLNDTDVDEVPVQGRLMVDSLPLHGDITYSADELALMYYPDSAFTGYDSLCYRVQDTLSAISNQAWVVIQTDSFNFVPRAVNDTIWVWEDDSVTFDVMANDWDVHNDSLWPTVASLLPSAALYDMTMTPVGLVYLEDDNAWTYKPQHDYYGRDSFYYFANDPKGAITRAQVLIEVRPVNDAPTVDMKYRSILYPENADWREVLFETTINDVDDTMMRGASLTVYGATMTACKLMIGQSDLFDRVEYKSKEMTLYLKDSLMSIEAWEQALNSIRYRNDSDNDSASRQFSLLVWDAAAMKSDTLTWMVNSLPENDPPQLLSLPQLGGRFLPDSVVTCTSGQWRDPDGEISYSYQWCVAFANGEQIRYDNNTKQLLVLPEMLNATQVWCEVVAYNPTEPPVYADVVLSDSMAPENHYPSALNLLADTIFRTDLSGTFVGELLGQDPDSLQTLSYQLITGRDSFYLVDDSLFLAISAYDFDTPKVSLSVRVQDNGAVPLAQDFIIDIYPYNDLMPGMLDGFPRLQGLSGDTVAIAIKADKPGIAHYAIVTASEVKSGLLDSSLMWSSDSIAFDAESNVELVYRNLASESDYYFAVQLVDTSLRYVSSSYFLPFRTLDVTGPQFVGPKPIYSAVDGVMLQLALSEPGHLFYRCRENDTTFTVDSSYIDTSFVDSAMLQFTASQLEKSFVFNGLKSQVRYQLALRAVDTLGNVNDTLCSFTTLDTISPCFRQGFPSLLDVSESRIRYHVRATEQGRLMVRLGTNYDEVDSFLTVYEADLYAAEEALQENVIHILRTEDLTIDGIYHLDFIMLDTAGNRSAIHSIDFQYPEPFTVILKKECLAYNDDIELEVLTEMANYCLYSISGELIQTGVVKPDLLMINIPSLNEGMYIIRFYNEFGDFSFRILQRGKF